MWFFSCTWPGNSAEICIITSQTAEGSSPSRPKMLGDCMILYDVNFISLLWFMIINVVVLCPASFISDLTLTYMPWDSTHHTHLIVLPSPHLCFFFFRFCWISCDTFTEVWHFLSLGLLMHKWAAFSGFFSLPYINSGVHYVSAHHTHTTRFVPELSSSCSAT